MRDFRKKIEEMFHPLDHIMSTLEDELVWDMLNEIERLRGLAENAFNEGFGEGMNEVQRHYSGGKSWRESRSFANLSVSRKGG